MIERDALLHYAHFICIFALASLLTGELFLFRKVFPPGMLHQLQIVDRFYGIAAGFVIASGVSLLFFGLKGAAFYLHNPVFWIKMALFVALGLLSNSRHGRLPTMEPPRRAGWIRGVVKCRVLASSGIALGASRGFCVHPALCNADGERVMTR